MQHQFAEIRLKINISLGGEEHPPRFTLETREWAPSELEFECQMSQSTLLFIVVSTKPLSKTLICIFWGELDTVGKDLGWGFNFKKD